MIHDLQLALPSPDLFADILVVGSGAAGIALAVELSRRGKHVLLLEGGGSAPEPTSQELYRTRLTGLSHRGVHEGRFRTHGGTTTQWGGQILELDSEDFEQRDWISGSGWPFPKKDLAPFYHRALAVEGLSQALLNDQDVWNTLGIAPPHPDGLELYLSRWCPEPNFARLHHQVLARDPRVTVWLHANAIELLLDENLVAIGVRCRTLSGIETIFRGHQVVFALGTIETCRFLMQPRAEKGLPWNTSGLLGCHFQDHIDSDAATLRPKSAKALHEVFDSIFLKGYKYNPKLRLSRESQRRAAVLSAGGTVFSHSDLDQELAQVKTTAKRLRRAAFGELTLAQIMQLLQHAPLVARQALRFTWQHRSYHRPDAELRLRVHCEQEPLSSSSLTLSHERDALGLLRGSLHWHISEMELRTIRHFVTTAQHALSSVCDVVPHPDLSDGDRFLAQCQDSFHHMGGMRMAASPSTGVVSPELRLHNTANVYICSGAVYPTSGFSNPTHTLLALAMRLAAHLAPES